MLSPFQQTLTSVISLVYAGDLSEAVRLIETVDQTVSTKTYKVLNDAVRLMESRRPDPRMGEKVKDLLGPLLKPGAPVPDPVRFRAAVQELESQLQFAAEGDDAEARWGKIERNHDVVEACKAYAPNGKAREAINDIVTVLEARNREPARRDDPLLKQYYETAHRILEPFLRTGAGPAPRDPFRRTLTKVLDAIHVGTVESIETALRLLDSVDAPTDTRRALDSAGVKLNTLHAMLLDSSDFTNPARSIQRAVQDVERLIEPFLQAGAAKNADSPSFRDLIRQVIAVYERLPEARTKAEKQKIDKAAWNIWHRATKMLGNYIKIALDAHGAMNDVSNAIHDKNPIDTLVPIALKKLEALLDPSLKVPDREKLQSILREAMALMEQDEAKAWRKAYELIRDAHPYTEWNAESLTLAIAGAEVAFAMGAYENPAKWADPMFVEGKKDALDAVSKLVRTTKLA